MPFISVSRNHFLEKYLSNRHSFSRQLNHVDRSIELMFKEVQFFFGSSIGLNLMLLWLKLDMHSDCMSIILYVVSPLDCTPYVKFPIREPIYIMWPCHSAPLYEMTLSKGARPAGGGTRQKIQTTDIDKGSLASALLWCWGWYTHIASLIVLATNKRETCPTYRLAIRRSRYDFGLWFCIKLCR